MHASVPLGQNPRVEESRGTSAQRPGGSLPAIGFLVVDGAFKLLNANREAVRILTYSAKPEQAENLADVFDKKIRRPLRAQGAGLSSSTSIEFKSGRRTYFCRAFLLESSRTASAGAVLVLERGISGTTALAQIARQFHMTPREQQILALLLQGLGTQEMAETLGLAANTIKAFIRLVMVKMGVRSRAAIVTKVLRLVLFGDSSLSSAVPAVLRVGDVGTKQKG